ncbi:amidohydrolase family protein [uncultured Desulfovibrio sp.]|uniref:amidohydrolase n=1 Tax=uncultured Desulfovibrio sp. TaxID=167968 RepID=UPI00262DB7D0|nr:amidohydrolase family protein [uncultured Desulfovibrio sp.]
MSNAKRKTSLTLASAALLGLLGTGYVGAATYDTVYYAGEGKIYTLAEETDNGRRLKDLDPANALTVEAVGVTGGKITYAGPAAGITADDTVTNKVTLKKGMVMLPGFVDGHGHFPGQGARDLYQIDLGSPPLGTMSSIADYQEALRTACENFTPDPANANDGIVAVGYDDTLITDMRHPTAEDIEAVCPGKRVRLSHISGHVAVASYALLAEGVNGKPLITSANDPTPTQTATDTAGVEIKDGKVTGVLFEMGAMAAAPTPAPKQDAQLGLARASEVFLSKGVTLADTGGAMIGGASGMDKTYQTGLLTEQKNRNLRLRVVVHPWMMTLAKYSMKSNLGNLYWDNLPAGDNPAAQDFLTSGAAPGASTPKIGADITSVKFGGATHTIASGLPADRLFLGAYKIVGDGSPQAYTAWMKDPGNYDWGDYTAADSDANKKLATTKYASPEFFNGFDGTLNILPDELKAIIELAHRNNVSTETHTNGSAYAEMWLEALELAVSKYPDIADTRHTSIHAQTFERDVVERLAGSYRTVNPQMSNQMFGSFGNAQNGTPNAYDASQVNGKDIDTMAELMRKQNFFASFFMTHTYYYGERHRDIFFGPGRAYNISPAGWATAFGLNYSLHNDNTITPIEPLQSVESAITRLSAKSLVSDGGQPIYYTGSAEKKNVDATDTFNQRKTDGVESDPREFYAYDQRINVLQALHAVTINPAFQNKLDDRIGTIETGKYADFVILNDDPMTLAESDPTKISDIRIVSTIVSDEVEYGVLPDSATFASDVKPGYLPGAIAANNVQATPLEGEAADKQHALDKGQARLACFSLTADAPNAGDVVLLQMGMLGNGKAVSDIHLFDVTDSANAVEFTYSDTAAPSDPGKFWIASQKAPKIPLPADTVLERDGAYIVYFTLADADNDTKIAAAVDLVSASGTLPPNDTPIASTATSGTGSDDDWGGCTVGTKPAYDLTILLGMLAGLVGLRGLRKRLFKA